MQYSVKQFNDLSASHKNEPATAKLPRQNQGICMHIAKSSGRMLFKTTHRKADIPVTSIRSGVICRL
jgi:crotonobetainyl-CoA:carnitine CoA-transferase CaiB-like acyl-CoA transferase